jgi:hypothetical protein
MLVHRLENIDDSPQVHDQALSGSKHESVRLL